MYYAIVAAVCILVGGFGGYQWGASVERRAAAILAKAGTAVGSAAKKV